MLLRDHLQEQHREGSIIAEGNQCQRNRGCKAARCATSRAERKSRSRRVPLTGGGEGGGDAAGTEKTVKAAVGAGETPGTEGTAATMSASVGEEFFAEDGGSRDDGTDERRGSGGDGHRRDDSGVGGSPKSIMWNGAGQICIPTAEEEGVPLPAALTLRFLAAMDEGYIGSMKEEIARQRKDRSSGGGA